MMAHHGVTQVANGATCLGPRLGDPVGVVGLRHVRERVEVGVFVIGHRRST